MFARRAVKAVAVTTVALFCVAGSLAVTVGAAGATTISNAIQAQSPFSAGTFDSGQSVDVVVPAGSGLTPGANAFILECAAPGGVDPATSASCDGNTGYQGGTITVQPDGSIDVMDLASDSQNTTSFGDPYSIYALPDAPVLNEPSTDTPKCGLGSAKECVLYIGQGGGGDTGFSQPHVFSQAFQVHPDPTDSGALNPGDGTFGADSAPGAISTANHATFTEGTAGTFSISATGYGPPAYTETGALPAGVTLKTTYSGLTSTGVLSGTPTQSGTFPITITANNGVGTPTTQAFTLTVDVAPAITSANNYTMTSGGTPNFTVTATGSPAPTFSDPGPLDGLSINATTGALTGTATSTGSFVSTITASNGVGTPATQSFTLTVESAGFHISTTSLPNGVAGQAYSQQLQTIGGGASVSWKKVSLPKGLALSVTGLLSGVPSTKAVGPTEVSVTATNGKHGTVASATIPFTVDEAPGFGKKPLVAAAFTEGTPATATITATGYPTPTITKVGSLPSGVTFVNGVLSGTPAVTVNSGTYPLTITASNGITPAATESFTLTVYAPLVVSGPASLPAGTAGVSYSGATFTATGADGIYVWKKVSLPKGLAISATGVLSGTPKSAGSYTVTVEVESKDGKVKLSTNYSVGLTVS